MSRTDLDVALGWARDEGWNPGLDDAEPFYEQDPSGFLMGWLDGEPICCISVVKYDASFAFLGLYIVRPNWRGQGYGKAIWDAGIASAGSRTIGLDGVVAQQDNYRKSGFGLAHRSARWGGVVRERLVADPKVRSITATELPAIMALDRECFPAARPEFLSRWLLDGTSRHSLCCVEGGTVVGYGTIRRSIEGNKIGPLFARTPDAAEALLLALASEVRNETIVVDVPAPNEPAIAIVRRLGFEPSFETARMYRGDAPSLAVEQIFGISTLELG